MCYDTAQLAYRIYKEAVRNNASDSELEYLKKRWHELAKGDGPELYHASGFNHPELFAFNRKENRLDLDKYTWGLIPHWVRDEKQAYEIRNKTINARGETIFEKPSFQKSAENARVIIPLEGFFEHHHKKGKTFPYFIRSREKRRLLVGGITSEWVNKTSGEMMKTISIVTTKANSIMKEIHNNPKLKEPRMPLLLEDSDLEQWLDGNVKEVEELIKPNITTELESYTVKRLRGKDYVGNSKEAQEEYIYDEMIDPPTLF